MRIGLQKGLRWKSMRGEEVTWDQVGEDESVLRQQDQKPMIHSEYFDRADDCRLTPCCVLRPCDIDTRLQ